MAPPSADDYNGGALVGTCICFLALTNVSVGLRTYARAVLTKNFQADDWLMLVAQAIFNVTCCFVLVGVRLGIGRHNKALPQEDEIEALMWQALAAAAYILNMLFIKLSVAVFLLRLSARRRYTYTLWASIFVVGAWSTAAFFWDLFQCDPVAAQWDFTLQPPAARCATAAQVVSGAYAFSAMTIASDWLYALLPVPMVWGVRMSARAKATVVVILGLGVFASIATIVRLKFLADLTDTDDLLFAATDAMVWTLVEPGVAIVASSLVTIRPLLRSMGLAGFSSAGATRSAGAAAAAATTGGDDGLFEHGSGHTLVDIEAATARQGDKTNSRSDAATANDVPPTTSSDTKGISLVFYKDEATEFHGGRSGIRRRSSASTGSGSGSGQSGIFVIEGPRRTPSPPRGNRRWGRDQEEGEEEDGGAEDRDWLGEAHSQHDGRVGLRGP